jgi:hypothetical protein
MHGSIGEQLLLSALLVRGVAYARVHATASSADGFFFSFFVKTRDQ